MEEEEGPKGRGKGVGGNLVIYKVFDVKQKVYVKAMFHSTLVMNIKKCFNLYSENNTDIDDV